MKSPLIRLLVAALGALVFQSNAFGAKNSQHKLSDWKIGKVLLGPEVKLAELTGKVVVIENWGVHCPPCIASLPHLAKLEKTHRDEGLVIIGAESQGSKKSEIKPLIEKAGVEYTITEGADGPLKVSSIPRAFVFDREGKLVFDGHPAAQEFEKAVESSLKEKAPAVAAAPAAPAGPLVASRTWKNTEGKEIVAAVNDATDSSVNFLMPGGKKIAYPMEKLDEESQAVIRKAVEDAKPKE